MDLIDELSHDSYCNFNNKAIIINQLIKQISMNGIIKWSNKLYSLITRLQPNDKENILEGMKEKLDLLVKDNKLSKSAPAPSFVFTDTMGKEYTPEDFKGKKVYIDVWATWCKPCIELQPAWDKLIDTYTDKDSVILFSFNGSNKRYIVELFKKTQASWSIVVRREGGWEVLLPSITT